MRGIAVNRQSIVLSLLDGRTELTILQHNTPRPYRYCFSPNPPLNDLPLGSLSP